MQQIRDTVQKYQGMTSAPFGIAFMDMESGEQYVHLGDQLFPIASSFKLFILSELFRQIEAGLVSMDERIMLDDSNKSIGSGLLRYFNVGCSLTVYDYVFLMLLYSDNSATDILLKRVGRENVIKNILVPYGFTQTSIDMNCQKMLEEYYTVGAPDGETWGPDNKRSYRNGTFFCGEAEKSVQSTPKEMLKLMAMLYHGEMVSPKVSKQMIDILKTYSSNNRIAKNLPSGTVVAHKTGSIDRVVNDVGLVYTPNGTFALVLLYNGNMASLERIY